MSDRKLWISAAVGNLVVGTASLAAHGFTAAAAASATRNTARFAVLFLLTGFAAPGLQRWRSSLPDSARLIRGYAAAQFVHFAFVLARHTVFADRIDIGLTQVVFSVLGFSLIAATAFTAGAETAGGRRIFTVLLYVNWIIVAIAYGKYHVRIFRLVDIAVLLALVLRWMPVSGEARLPIAVRR